MLLVTLLLLAAALGAAGLPIQCMWDTQGRSCQLYAAADYFVDVLAFPLMVVVAIAGCCCCAWCLCRDSPRPHFVIVPSDQLGTPLREMRLP